MPQTLDDILAVDGPIAGVFGADFELRPQQLDMARAVDRTLSNRRHLLVEAGTGVGKSFAYLVPAIRAIIERGERVVVATNTIALQEQIIQKDLPLLMAAFAADDESEPPFRAELVKGRGNYLSVRRLALASRKQEKLFTDAASKRSLHEIEDWAYETSDGTLATLPQLERPAVWDRVQSDSGNCMGRRCPTYDQCFYQTARRRMERADLLICNHALFFSDLALRVNDAGFLPKYDHVILDEAHHVEDVAGEHFGVSLAEGRVFHLLSMLYARGRNRERGFLPTLDVLDDALPMLDKAMHLVLEASDIAKDFFGALVERVRDARSLGTAGNAPDEAATAAVEQPGLFPLDIADRFRRLSLLLRSLRPECRHEEDKFELNSYADRALAISADAESLVNQELDGCAYWVEVTRTGRASLSCAPVEVAPILERELFDKEHSVVLTSATLTISNDPETAFNHCRVRLGCPEAPAIALGSPFDHAKVTLHLHREMPDPRDERYMPALTDAIRKHLLATDGGAFVLFTSFRTMHRVADDLRRELESSGMPVWVHGRDGSRSAILEGFRNNERSVLFGTSSFWQGVDVRGRGLRNVIITRLPFDPPDRPIVQARHEMLKQQGGNPFMQDSLPRAIIRFKQGFGRLVRSATDEGRVVVLDPRIRTKFYGRLFLKALPEGVEVVEERHEGA